jgi:hypothetical protein
MTRGKRKTALVAVGGCLAALFVATSVAYAAQAIIGVTSSNVTSPKDVTYLVYNKDSPNTFSVAGTTNGTTGNHVDLICHSGDDTEIVASNVAVSGDGSFSVPAASLEKANLYRVCELKAVPTGTTPDPLTPYTGPRLLVGLNHKYTISSGPNNDKVYDFDTEAQQLDGSFDYDSLGGCGIDDGYMLDSNNALSTLTFYCNAWFAEGGELSPTRSELQIDGLNAYPSATQQDINPDAAGFTPVNYSYTLNPKNGNFVIHDTEKLVKCPNQAWPPTTVTCASFVSAGVTDYRTMSQDHRGRVVWVKDVFTSTDGKSHKLDLQWQNDQRFWGGNSGDAGNTEYKFPGQSGYAKHVLNDVVTVPAKPGAIFIRSHGAPDGNTTTGRGAIVYNRPAIKATFNRATTNHNDFKFEQKATVPAKGSVTFRVAYIQAFLAKDVASVSAVATKVVHGCTVPNVVGKSLTAAKTAITRAHCAVGRVSHKASAQPAGSVISETPQGGANVDYRSKVGLVVSKG